jgi:hypothetical protein
MYWDVNNTVNYSVGIIIVSYMYSIIARIMDHVQLINAQQAHAFFWCYYCITYRQLMCGLWIM